MKTIISFVFALILATPAFATRIYSQTTTWVISEVNCKIYITTFWLDPGTPETTADDRVLGQDSILDCDHEHQLTVPDPDNIQIAADGTILMPDRSEWMLYSDYLNRRNERLAKRSKWAKDQGLIYPPTLEPKTIKLMPKD